jgi:hypothetical protein
MEVHAHSHTPRKKWTHYFWEFLMLFLAVFCGFLAENQREHMIEHQREKQYMVSMLEDLKSDTSLLNIAVKYWDNINSSIDSVADAIQFSITNTDLLKVYRHLSRAFDYYSFKNNDRTIAQLKNSGGFRLIRKKIVAGKIILFDQFNIDAAKNIAEQHNFFYENVVTLRNKVFVQEVVNKIFEKFDFVAPPVTENKWIDSLLDNSIIPLPPATQTALLFEFKNALLAYRKDFSNMDFGYDELKLQMDELIKNIQENYHLK